MYSAVRHRPRGLCRRDKNIKKKRSRLNSNALFFSVFYRRYTHYFFKVDRKICCRGKTGLLGYLLYRQVGALQQPQRPLDSFAGNVFAHRTTKKSAEILVQHAF